MNSEMYDVWAWDEAVGDDSQVIARISDLEANRMVAGGHLRHTEGFRGAVVAGPPSSESRWEALVMLGAVVA